MDRRTGVQLPAGKFLLNGTCSSGGRGSKNRWNLLWKATSEIFPFDIIDTMQTGSGAHFLPVLLVGAEWAKRGS